MLIRFFNHLRALYAQQSIRVTFAPPVLPRLLARDLARTFSSKPVIIYFDKRSLQLMCCLPSRDMAGSRLLPLSKIHYCCLERVWTVLSSSVADHSSKPAKDHRLGRPLPYQLPNPTQAPQKAKLSFIYLGFHQTFW